MQKKNTETAHRYEINYTKQVLPGPYFSYFENKALLLLQKSWYVLGMNEIFGPLSAVTFSIVALQLCSVDCLSVFFVHSKDVLHMCVWEITIDYRQRGNETFARQWQQMKTAAISKKVVAQTKVSQRLFGWKIRYKNNDAFVEPTIEIW